MQCSKILRNGNQCKNKTCAGSLDFCKRHHVDILKICYMNKYENNLDSCDNHWINGNELTIQMVSEQPCYVLPTENAYLALIMFDPDAPRPKKNGNQYLHWLIINIKSGVGNKFIGQETSLTHDEIVRYRGPSPPSDSGVHHYIFVLLEQNSHIDPSSIRLNSSEFNYDNFIHKYRLIELDQQFFTIQSNKAD